MHDPQIQPAEGPVVLIIEDDPATAQLYALLFGQSGLQTLVAHDSRMAKDYLRSAQPDALVLDVMMPDESGLELCRDLRDSPVYADVPVIMVSALTQSEDVQAGLDAGANEYLTKPVSPGTLTQTVQRWISRVGSRTVPASSLGNLAFDVQRTVLEVRRRIAEIARAHRVFEAHTKQLEREEALPASQGANLMRRAFDLYRSRVLQSEAAGWRALEGTLRRIEQLEVAVRRRGVHEPKTKEQWELARARRPFVREDCWQWARSCPEHILVEYSGALDRGDRIYAYLLERYGQWALEQASEWEQLFELRRRVLAASRLQGGELESIERLYAELTPLMAELSRQQIPDQVVFVSQALGNGQSIASKANGQSGENRHSRA